ncbi:MAG: mechanosensitive ion channel family protein [Oleiphilaceae bacterium]|nr:mechanosensitive ion channel family protein [Oleiphilaceae bacterium]
MEQFISAALQQLSEAFYLEALGQKFGAFLVATLLAVMTFAGFYLLWLLLRMVINRIGQGGHIDITTRNFIQITLKFLILTLGAIQALKVIGIDTASLIAGLGIAGLTIGFAARDALSNLISGVLIFWDRPFVIDDLIEIDGQYGRVDKITLRSTRVVTPDGRMLAIPNTTVINSIVSSYTNFPHLCLGLDIGVGVNEDIDQVREILLSLVADDEDFMSRPDPKVVVTSLGDYSNTLRLSVWLKDERQHGAKLPELRERAYKALLEAGVDMPCETLQLNPVKVAIDHARP